MARRTVSSVEEILQIAREKGMPLKKMRFFIGEDCREPRCFGIYQDPETGEWVVYKNKSDGNRAERYRGTNEALAAQEIWDKLSDEVEMRRTARGKSTGRTGTRSGSSRSRSGSSFADFFKRYYAVILIILTAGAFVISNAFSRRNGYYVHDGRVYYVQNERWYSYDNGGWDYFYDYEDSWYDDYYGRTYDFEDSSQAFEQSDYYVEPSDSDYDDDDWDDDDWDSWDSSDTDWDSDW